MKESDTPVLTMALAARILHDYGAFPWIPRVDPVGRGLPRSPEMKASAKTLVNEDVRYTCDLGWGPKGIPWHPLENQKKITTVCQGPCIPSGKFTKGYGKYGKTSEMHLWSLESWKEQIPQQALQIPPKTTIAVTNCLGTKFKMSIKFIGDV